MRASVSVCQGRKVAQHFSSSLFNLSRSYGLPICPRARPLTPVRLPVTYVSNYHSDSSADPIKRPTKSKKPTINFDTLGTWDSRLDFPLELNSSLNYGTPIPKISPSRVGTSSQRGRRTYNEDRHVVQQIRPDLLFFAVFDGHGGSQCADYCYRLFEKHLRFWLNRDEVDLERALESVFLELNNSFARWWTYNESSNEANSSGSTATVGLLRHNVELVLGHVGDSRALLCRDGDARRLTTDHCPSLLAERNRIAGSGGKVVIDSIGRSLVNGRLAMTRSIGDMDLKPFGVTAVPDLRKLQIKHGRDAFLALTTDGINCVLSDQEIVEVVKRCTDPIEAAHALTDQALHYSTEDNATALIIPFGSWGKYSTSASMFYSFGKMNHLRVESICSDIDFNRRAHIQSAEAKLSVTQHFLRLKDLLALRIHSPQVSEYTGKFWWMIAQKRFSISPDYRLLTVKLLEKLY